MYFVSQSFDTLWTLLMYSTDLMTTEFDSFLDKNYSDKYEKIESELTVLKMQYQLNLKIHR
jgi:hypothetical protein